MVQKMMDCTVDVRLNVLGEILVLGLPKRGDCTEMVTG
jgi:hypothetical protein